MLASEIISLFETYVDDTTELSTQEELALLNRVYHKVCDDRPWEFLKKEASGTLTTTTTIALPSDFSYLLENGGYTDNSFDETLPSKPVYVFINDNMFQVVNWGDRRQYSGQNNICYLDLANDVIKLPKAQSASATYSFDYKAFPSDLGESDSPIFPARFHAMIAHGMAVDDMIMQLFDKARSYARENEIKYERYMEDLAMWNSRLLMN